MKLDIELIRQSFEYCPLIGLLRWRFRPIDHFKSKQGQEFFNNKYPGKEAGNIHFNPKGKKNYRRVHVFGKSIFAHHIIWALQNGVWPESIDHHDGNGLNNKWPNIREADSCENMKNLRRYDNNKTGKTGIYPHGDKWRARIRVDKSLKCLGIFEEFGDAVKAREAAELKYGFHSNHGVVRPR